MKGFKNIKFFKHKGLNGGFLENLKKINVLSGPNNSGKTTVLEAIADENLRAIGLELDAVDAESIAQASLSGTGWNGAYSSNQHLNLIYIDQVKSAIGQRKLWFSSEAEAAWAPIERDWKIKFNTWGKPIVLFKSSFGSVFQEKNPSSILIPAKRRLATTERANASRQLSPSGEVILSFLFMAKNQDETSTNRINFNEIFRAFKEITDGFVFDIFSDAENQIELCFKRDGGGWIKAKDCGLGFQDLIVILFISIATDNDVILIEEPENHLHPEIQRRLIYFLRENIDKQFFISTHSSIFLNTQYADRIFSCQMKDSVAVENITSRALALASLGYSISDNLTSDLVILCEGPNDKLVLEEFLKKMGLMGQYNIKLWPLGGDIMDKLDLSVFGQSYRLVALLDHDPKSGKIRKRFTDKCKELHIPVFRLVRYAIENYFTIQAIRTVSNQPLPSDIMELDPKRKVSDQLGFEIKGRGWEIAKEMSLEDIKDTDFMKFLEQVKSMVTDASKS